ncbi:MAG: hypothetical protein MK066_01345 [Crocinitomicaceae bacterium]|nr:hypothetical protein [Crocinitomicaceae bacterium]
MKANSKLSNRIAVGILIGFFGIASCASLGNAQKGKKIEETNKNAEVSKVADAKTPLDTSDMDILLGMTNLEAQSFAKEYDILFRVVKEDGEFYPITKDYRVGRINATIEDGRIVDYFIEGKEKDKKDKWIGLTEKEAIAYARKNKIPFRIIQIDGEHMIVTDDYISGRVSVTINKGIVTAYSVE